MHRNYLAALLATAGFRGRRLVLALLACVAGGAPLPAADVDPDQAKFYREQVEPILAKRCNSCHGPKSQLKGGLFLGSRADLIAGGESGAAVDLEHPDRSLLLAAINYQTYEMPPTGKLPAEEIALLTRWVNMGVPFPSDAETKRPHSEAGKEPEVNAQTKQYWAFQPVRRPDLPTVAQTDWPAQPIDHFILARLEAAGLAPAAPAEKIPWIRRATYDLTGLPPTLEQVQAFLADDSPRAFERVVDRLLESPQYGERWGRHWLDVVRYAESNSYERDGTKPFAWRYRDYVIRSFNEDKPYTQFIKEQLAGDELEPKTADSIIATGYYRLGIWDDEPVSQHQALYDDLDDILGTTSQAFLGLTLNCARCHNHKLDPIPQKDYYRFLAFFNGIRRYGVRSDATVAEASIGPIAVSAEQRKQAALSKQLDRELGGLNRKIDDVNRQLHAMLTPPEKDDFKAVEVRVDLARKYVGKGLSKELVDEYAAAVARKQEIADTRPAAIAEALIVKEIGPQPRETHLLVRGNANVPGELVTPGFPSVLSPPDPQIAPPASGESSGRRLALANWIASDENPLTARVIVNRVWQHHFGRGIVGTSNNFGQIGERPTHPQLLDWLASELIADRWRLKPLHRKIMLSSAYRMSSTANEAGLKRDPANRLWWRFDMRRLSAEELRDSILAVSGTLNPKMGGPSIYPLIPQEVLAGQSRPGAGWGNSSPEERARRSVYIFVKRSLVEPTLADFDFADVDSTCPVRFVTTQPTQALALLNSEFANRQAGEFASYLKQHAGDATAAQVKLCLLRITQRQPSPEEIDRGVRLIESLAGGDVSADDALRYFCLLSYNLNEFLYLD